VLGAVFQVCGYAIMITVPPFPVLVCAYVIVGFALAVLVDVSSMTKTGLHTTKLSLLCRVLKQMDSLEACGSICQRSSAYYMDHMVSCFPVN